MCRASLAYSISSVCTPHSCTRVVPTAIRAAVPATIAPRASQYRRSPASAGRSTRGRLDARGLRAVFVCDREHLVEDLEALVELLARDVQRRGDREDVPVHERVQAAVEARLGDSGNRLRRLAAGVERDERLPCLAVLDQLQPPEQPEASDFADAWVLLGEKRELLAHVVALRRRVLDDALLAKDLDRGDPGRAREWMAAVGQPSGEERVLDRV